MNDGIEGGSLWYGTVPVYGMVVLVVWYHTIPAGTILLVPVLVPGTWYLIRQTFITILNVKIISLDFHYPSLIFIWHKPNLCEKKETFIYVYK